MYFSRSFYSLTVLPGSRGAVIIGGIGFGKMAVIHQLIQHSCFGDAAASGNANLAQQGEEEVVVNKGGIMQECTLYSVEKSYSSERLVS